jgi:hypothetical protein
VAPAAKPKVLRSVNSDETATRCVDLFERQDGGPEPFGFEEYRRDPEDGRGWFPVGGHADRRFPSAEAAWAAALAEVPWLADALD